MPEQPPRVLPVAEGPREFFWRSGADDRLRFLQCSGCSYLIHPPTGYCPQCGGREVAPQIVSGRGTVYSFTINHQPWDDVGDIYVIALIDIEEQSGLRLVTNIVDIAPEDVVIGMPVEVVFENHDPIYLPMFRPAAP